MLGYRFNPQLARGRVQSSDWPARLSIRIKRILNIAFIQFLTSKFHYNSLVHLITILHVSFKNLSLFEFYFLGPLEPNTGNIPVHVSLNLLGPNQSF